MLGVRQRCATSDEGRQKYSERCTRSTFSAIFDAFVILVMLERM
jgi:hypothetical protein